ncbi:MAG: ammonia-dependent NAD(+) synthetase [Streptococcaceae bacterium]|jgi:NAD+ synthase|nr:ammonia-dependent NAD(+) synthetase [Streptococcaceae bacterium]
MTLQEKIIKESGVQPTIDPQAEIRRSIDFMKEVLYKFSFIKTFVLGISGGQDSALVGRLAQLTMEEIRKEIKDEGYKFIAVRLPYGVQMDEEDAKRALAFIKPDQLLTVNIKEPVDAQAAALSVAGIEVHDFMKGNIKARQRMITQYAIADRNSGIVLGTDHAAENVMGFFTKYGDGGADLLPIFRLNKRQGKALLKTLEADYAIYQKVPTADLEDQKPGIADEKVLGVTYEEIDDYTEGKTVSPKAQSVIESWWIQTQHKRHLPVTVFDNFWK